MIASPLAIELSSPSCSVPNSTAAILLPDHASLALSAADATIGIELLESPSVVEVHSSMHMCTSLPAVLESAESNSPEAQSTSGSISLVDSEAVELQEFLSGLSMPEDEYGVSHCLSWFSIH